MSNFFYDNRSLFFIEGLSSNRNSSPVCPLWNSSISSSASRRLLATPLRRVFNRNSSQSRSKLPKLQHLLFSFEEIFSDASEEGLNFKVSGFFDFSLSAYFLGDSSDIPPGVQRPLEFKVSLLDILVSLRVRGPIK